MRHRCNHIGAQGKKCEAAFYDPKELQIHQRKHTGELPFICGYCGSRYISKATLVQHEKAKHLETEVSLNLACIFHFVTNIMERVVLFDILSSYPFTEC